MKKNYNWRIFSTYRSELMCVSIIGVLFCHILTNAAEHGVTDFSIFMQITMIGSCFVDSFLFLSGIGLYHSLHKDPRIGAFYKRRYLKLVIPYSIVAIPTSICWGIKNGADVYSTILYLTGASLFTTGEPFAWYVTASAVFYLFFPIIYKYIFTGRHELLKTFSLCAVAVVLTYVLRAINYSLFLNVDIALMRIPVFIVGIYCGKLCKEAKPINNRLLLGLFVVGGITLALRITGKIPSFISYYHVSVLGIFAITAAALILDFAMQYKTGKYIGSFLKMGGEYTLELYLCHIASRQFFNSPYIFWQYLVCCVLIPVMAAILVKAASHKISTYCSSREDRKLQGPV